MLRRGKGIVGSGVPTRNVAYVFPAQTLFDLLSYCAVAFWTAEIE